MRYIDVFNGDADGIFSLIQWRKANPISSSDEQLLVTGVKRDIALLEQVTNSYAANSTITVLDVSFDKNVGSVKRLLGVCNHIFYCDHHKADQLFEHHKLSVKINTEPSVCTGLLVNGQLKGEHPLWALAATYGDGLDHIAKKYADSLAFDTNQQQQLKELGVLVNYNGYGSTVGDLHYKPSELYQLLFKYETPFDVIADPESPYSVLKKGYDADIALARNSQQLSQEGIVATILDDAAWARRISGTYGNQLAADSPDKPIVVVTNNASGSYTISLRAPKNNPYGASTICSQFKTGGGREGAAGINQLPVDELNKFLDIVVKYYK